MIITISTISVASYVGNSSPFICSSFDAGVSMKTGMVLAMLN